MPADIPPAFESITQRRAPLAKYTYLKIGGPAEYLISPTSVDELAAVVKWAGSVGVPLRVLGDGTNLLVREGEVPGVTLRLRAPAFSAIEIDGKRVRVGGGANLIELIRATASAGLAGFETLAGIVATIGGALRYNAGDRQGEIADCFRLARVIDEAGKSQTRDRRDLQFGERRSDLDDPVIYDVEFELEPDKPDHIDKRMRRSWIYRKEAMPYPHQTALRMFRAPRGYALAELLTPTGGTAAKDRAVHISERNGNFLIVGPGATATEILEMVDQVQSRVRASSGVVLEREFSVW